MKTAVLVPYENTVVSYNINSTCSFLLENTVSVQELQRVTVVAEETSMVLGFLHEFQLPNMLRPSH